MAAADTELAKELATIIKSAYPVSLQNLARACTQSDAHLVRACVRQLPPCAIAKLASSLYDALPLWQCCVDILHHLCTPRDVGYLRIHLTFAAQSVEFKTELLSSKPSLLDALLAKANASEHDFIQYHALGIELLSHPLPEVVPLPASARSFFMRVFEQASRKPDVQSLRPVYCMLNGACRGFLALLPSDASTFFDEQLKKIFESKHAEGNSMLLLWCFGVAILAEHPELIEDPKSAYAKTGDRTDYAVPTVKWVTASGRRLFETAKACKKTIHVACLSVIWAIKGGVSISGDEALQGIRIATRIMQSVNRDILDHWVNEDPRAKSVLPKLLEKIQRKDIDPGIQREALYFYAVVGGSRMLYLPAIELFETLMTDMSSWGDINSTNSLTKSLSLFADHVRQHSVQSLICQILEANLSPASTDQLQNTVALVNATTATALHHENISSHILAALSKHEVQDLIEAFLADCTSNSKKDPVTFCSSHDDRIRQTYVSATISMLLTIILADPDRSPHVPSWVGIALVEKQRQLSAPPPKCTHKSDSSISSVSLFEQECTPVSSLPLQDWRSRLKHEIDNQASYQRDSLIRAVAQICHDLEVRCDTIEGPLRCEREKSSTLEEELSRSRACVESLEQKRVDDSLFLGTIEAEKARLERDKDELSNRLEALRMDMEKSHSQAETALHEAKEAYKHTEMQLRSTIRQKEETIREHQAELGSLHDRTTTLDNELKKQESGRHDLTNQYNDLQDRFEKEQVALEEQRQKTVRLQGHLRETENRLREKEEIATRQEKEIERLGEDAAEFEDLKIRHYELVQTSTTALEDVENQCESDLKAAASKATEEYSLLHGAYDDMRQNLERVQLSIPPLRAKIQELERTCSTKDHELGDLRAWKTRVFASIGPPPPPEGTPVHDSSKAPCQRSVALQRHADLQKRNKDAGMGQETTIDTIDHSVNPSSSQTSRSGFTSKRSEFQSTSKGLSIRTPYHHSSTTLSQRQRLILRPMSPNRRHTTIGVSSSEQKDEVGGRQSLPLKKRRRGNFQGSDETDFKVDPLTSTPFTPGEFRSEAGLQEDGSTAEL